MNNILSPDEKWEIISKILGDTPKGKPISYDKFVEATESAVLDKLKGMGEKAPILALNDKYPRNKDIEAIQTDQRDADQLFYKASHLAELDKVKEESEARHELINRLTSKCEELKLSQSVAVKEAVERKRKRILNMFHGKSVFPFRGTRGEDYYRFVAEISIDDWQALSQEGKE